MRISLFLLLISVLGCGKSTASTESDETTLVDSRASVQKTTVPVENPQILPCATYLEDAEEDHNSDKSAQQRAIESYRRSRRGMSSDKSLDTTSVNQNKTNHVNENRIVDTIRRNILSAKRSMQPDEMIKALRLEQFKPVSLGGMGSPLRNWVQLYRIPGREFLILGLHQDQNSKINQVSFAGHRFKVAH